MHEIFSEPFEEEFIVSTILRNNELACRVTKGARYGELTSGELATLEYRPSSVFGGILDKDSFYKHTLHPIGVLFDKVRLQSMLFVPRGNLRICVQCVKEDVNNLGTSYIHRQHVMPGTLVCHLHATNLLDTCPVCNLEIKRHRINKLSACISQINALKVETSPDSATHRYSQFVHDILRRTDSEKYRRHALPTMDISLKKLGYSSSSKTDYSEVCIDADKKIGVGEGLYQRSSTSKHAGHTPMHSFPRIAYFIYETVDNFISEIEEYCSFKP